MRQFVISAVAAATLACVAPPSADAQVIVGGGYPSYYGSYYSPSYYGTGVTIGNGGLIQTGLSYALGSSGYSGGYGYSPWYSGGYGYSSYSYPAYSSGYGNRGYGYGNRYYGNRYGRRYR